MRKINFARAHQVLTEKEMKNVLGGSGGSCPSGQFKCTCNGRDYGCVSSPNNVGTSAKRVLKAVSQGLSAINIIIFSIM